MGTDPAPADRPSAPDIAPDLALGLDAKRALAAWAPPRPRAARAPDPTEQRRLADEFLAALSSDTGALWKAGPPAHLTASCIVFDACVERVALTHHRKANAWFQFGGHLEPGDPTLRAAAAREAFEESGIPRLTVTADPVMLDRHELVGDFGRCREHLDVRYAAVAPAEATPVASAESLSVGWFVWNDLPVRDDGAVEPGLARLVAVGRAVLLANR